MMSSRARRCRSPFAQSECNKLFTVISFWMENMQEKNRKKVLLRKIMYFYTRRVVPRCGGLCMAKRTRTLNDVWGLSVLLASIFHFTCVREIVDSNKRHSWRRFVKFLDFTLENKISEQWNIFLNTFMFVGNSEVFTFFFCWLRIKTLSWN